jgi:hypothetical protein
MVYFFTALMDLVCYVNCAVLSGAAKGEVVPWKLHISPASGLDLTCQTSPYLDSGCLSVGLSVMSTL